MAAAAILLMCSAQALGQTFDLTGHVDVIRHAGEPSHLGSAEVVIWLTPLDTGASTQPVPGHSNYVLTQKNKQFTPHLLVVPVGSSVDFPNLDPFFHNVFSLFNGKRFDLGLYEGHSHRSVQFDREGVSYIFCNIHPDMGAVVVALKTPYVAVSTIDGTIRIQGVPRGRYRLNVWAEDASVEQLNGLTRNVDVAPQHTSLGLIKVETNGDTRKHHNNKFGEPYRPVPHVPY